MHRDLDIRINVFSADKKYELHTCAYEYRNLMELIYDKLYLEGFGDCRGTGRCGTCHVLLVNYFGDLTKREGNEYTTLHKLSTSKDNSRLSCQILLDKMVDGITVEVVQDDASGLY